MMKSYKPFFELILDDKYYELMETTADTTTSDFNEKVLFMIKPDAYFLNNFDVVFFLEKAPFEDQSKKNDFMLEFYNSTIQDAIEMRKLLYDKNSDALNWLFNLNYHTCEIISAWFALAINATLITTLSLKSPMNPLDEDGSVMVDNPYKLFIFNIGFLHQIFLTLVLANYFCFGAYRLYNFEFKREHYTPLSENIFFI